MLETSEKNQGFSTPDGEGERLGRLCWAGDHIQISTSEKKMKCVGAWICFRCLEKGKKYFPTWSFVVIYPGTIRKKSPNKQIQAIYELINFCWYQVTTKIPNDISPVL